MDNEKGKEMYEMGQRLMEMSGYDPEEADDMEDKDDDDYSDNSSESMSSGPNDKVKSALSLFGK